MNLFFKTAPFFTLAVFFTIQSETTSVLSQLRDGLFPEEELLKKDFVPELSTSSSNLRKKATSTIESTSSQQPHRVAKKERDELPDDDNKPNGRLPNVLFIGAQKAGTTATTTYLERQWQSVCLGDGGYGANGNWRRKEMHFFNGHDFQKTLAESNETRSTELIDEYRGYYVNCTKRLALDATTLYLNSAETIRWAYETYDPELFKQLKIMVTLREPISRDVSWYNHQICTNSFWANDVHDSSIGWDGYVKEERQKKAFVDEGNYAKALKGWMDNFDRNQLLILSYDELKTDPKSYFDRIKNFLEITDETPPGLMAKEANVQDCKNKVRTPSCTDEFQMVSDLYTKSNSELYKLLEANPGPSMEQNPFPAFKAPKCEPAEANVV